MKTLVTLLLCSIPAILICQTSGDFRFDDTSVTFPDGSVQNTAASSNSEASINVPPNEQLIYFIRASLTGINGSAIESEYINHLEITGLDLCIDTDNSAQFKVTPGLFMFTKANDIATVDLLSNLKSNNPISNANFKIISIDNSGMLFLAHEFILTKAKIIKVQNKIRYEDSKGYFFEEEYTLSYESIEIRNSIGNQESESFIVPR